MWKYLTRLLEPVYDKIGNTVAEVAVLHADETGWRVNGKTPWLWCFTSKNLCYYIIVIGDSICQTNLFQ